MLDLSKETLQQYSPVYQDQMIAIWVMIHNKVPLERMPSKMRGLFGGIWTIEDIEEMAGELER